MTDSGHPLRSRSFENFPTDLQFPSVARFNKLLVLLAYFIPRKSNIFVLFQTTMDRSCTFTV